MAAESNPHPELTDTSTLERLGLFTLFFIFVVFGGWAYNAPISGAVVAPGIFVVENYKQVVQHYEGGVVRSIHVKEGQFVHEGELLVSLDDDEINAHYKILKSQLASFNIVLSRLIAERNHQDYLPLDDLFFSAEDEVIFKEELAKFKAREADLNGYKDIITKQSLQYDEQISGLMDSISSQKALIASYDAEISDLKALYKKGYVDKRRVRENFRKIKEIESMVAQQLSMIAQARVKKDENALILDQKINEFELQVAESISDVSSKIRAKQKEINIIKARIDNALIRSPVSGIISGLYVNTIGGVISEGEAVIDLLPADENLLIESHVDPMDIDLVSLDVSADIDLVAINDNFLPKIKGSVVYVSPDVVSRESTAPYYKVLVQLNNDYELDKLDVLGPGMPVQVYIDSGEKTLFQYLVRPVHDILHRAFSES